MPTVQQGKRPGRTRGRPEDKATAGGLVYTRVRLEGVDVVADVQTVTSDGTGGTFTLATAGDVTGTIAWNATVGVVETAIETLDEYTAATVTGAAGAWVITSNDGAGLPGETLVVDNTLLTGGTAVNVHTTTGVANVFEQINLVVDADDGDYVITVNGNDSAAVDASTDGADEIEVLVEAITGVTAVEVTGSGTRKDPFIIIFAVPAGDVGDTSVADTSLEHTVVVAARQVGPGDRE